MGFDESESIYERPMVIIAIVSASDGERMEDWKISLSAEMS